MSDQQPSESPRELDQLRSRAAALEQLLEVQEQTVIGQSQRLEKALADLRRYAEQLVRSNAQLADSEARMRTIVETAADAIITIDEQGIVESMNTAAVRMFGHSVEELVGRNIKLLMPQPYCDEHDGYIQRYLETGEKKVIGQRHEVLGTRKDGSTFPIELAVSEVPLDGHRIFAGVVRDISERKQAEAKLRDLADDLARSNEELEQFAYVVSHDLKAPLRGVASLANILAEDHAAVLDANGRQNLQLLVDRTQRMKNLIDGVLQYSRAGSTRGRLEMIDSDRLARDTVDLLAPPESVTVCIAGTLPEVVYDGTQLEQVFQNLITNGIKHLDKPAGEVVVSCRDAGPFWEFCVRDNGPGIPEQQVARIFELFQTLKSPAETESTGVGLSVVKRIVERHGGSVTVESTVGEGSRFVFTVPKGVSEQ